MTVFSTETEGVNSDSTTAPATTTTAASNSLTDAEIANNIPVPMKVVSINPGLNPPVVLKIPTVTASNIRLEPGLSEFPSDEVPASDIPVALEVTSIDDSSQESNDISASAAGNIPVPVNILSANNTAVPLKIISATGNSAIPLRLSAADQNIIPLRISKTSAADGIDDGGGGDVEIISSGDDETAGSKITSTANNADDKTSTADDDNDNADCHTVASSDDDTSNDNIASRITPAYANSSAYKITSAAVDDDDNVPLNLTTKTRTNNAVDDNAKSNTW